MVTNTFEEISFNKGGHFYLLRYRRGQEELASDYIANWANDSRLNLTWSNASDLGELLRTDAPEPPGGLSLGSLLLWTGLALVAGRML